MRHFYIGIHPECGIVHRSSVDGDDKKDTQQFIGEMMMDGLEVKHITQEEYKGYDFCFSHPAKGKN